MITITYKPFYVAWVPIRGRAPGLFTPWGWVFKSSSALVSGRRVQTDPHWEVYGAFPDGPQPERFDSVAAAVEAAKQVDTEWRIVRHLRPVIPIEEGAVTAPLGSSLQWHPED